MADLGLAGKIRPVLIVSRHDLEALVPSPYIPPTTQRRLPLVGHRISASVGEQCHELAAESDLGNQSVGILDGTCAGRLSRFDRRRRNFRFQRKSGLRIVGKYRVG